MPPRLPALSYFSPFDQAVVIEERRREGPEGGEGGVSCGTDWGMLPD